MANFKDVLKKQRESDKGVFESLGKSAMMVLAEKADLRNYVFKKDSFMSALFPKVKGYKADVKKDDLVKKTPEKDVSVDITKRLDIIAKNTLALPMMARDINVMRQSLIKMVKIWDGEQKNKADMFFLKEAERERLYESMLGKKKESSPTAAGKANEKEKKNFFDDLIGSLIKGGLIAGLLYGIGKYFLDPEFRKSVQTMLNNFGETVFGKEGWQEIKNNVMTGLLSIVAGFAILKLIPTVLTSAVSLLARGLVSLLGPIGLLLGALGVGATVGAAMLTGKNEKTIDDAAKEGDVDTLKKLINTSKTMQVDEFGRGPSVEDSEDEMIRRLKLANTPNAKRAIQTIEAERKNRLAKQELDKLNRERENLTPAGRPLGKTPYTKEEWNAEKKRLQEKFDKDNSEKIKKLKEQVAAPIPKAPDSEKVVKDWAYSVFIGKNKIEEVPERHREKVGKILQNVPEEWKKDALKKSGVEAGDTGNMSPQNVFDRSISMLEEAAKGNYGVSTWGMDSAQPTPRNQTNVPNASPTSPTPAGSSGDYNGNSKEAMDFFISKGWTPEQAAGIVGNLIIESGNFSSDVISGKRRGDGGKAVGIAQWHPPRQAIFEKQYGKPLAGASFREQLEFVNWELNNTEKEAGDSLKKAKTADEAARIVDSQYERSSGQAIQQRQQQALALLDGKYQPTPATGGEGTQYAANAPTPAQAAGTTGSAAGTAGVAGLGAEQSAYVPQLMAALTGQQGEGAPHERLAGLFGGTSAFGGLANTLSSLATSTSGGMELKPAQKDVDSLSNVLQNGVVPGNVLNEVSRENTVSQASPQPTIIDNSTVVNNTTAANQAPQQNQNSKTAATAYDSDLFSSLMMRNLA